MQFDSSSRRTHSTSEIKQIQLLIVVCAQKKGTTYRKRTRERERKWTDQELNWTLI